MRWNETEEPLMADLEADLNALVSCYSYMDRYLTVSDTYLFVLQGIEGAHAAIGALSSRAEDFSNDVRPIR